MCFLKLIFGKRQHYSCKYPAWNFSFLETCKHFPSQVFSLFPILAYCMESEFKCVLPALKYSSMLRCKGKQEKFWYSVNWSSYGWSYLTPYWRVCIINEVAGNRRDSDYASTFSFSRHFLGMTFRKVALPVNIISARWRVQRNVSLLCAVYVPQRDMLDQTQGHPAMQICPWSSRWELAPILPAQSVGRIRFCLIPNYSVGIPILLNLHL